MSYAVKGNWGTVGIGDTRGYLGWSLSNGALFWYMQTRSPTTFAGRGDYSVSTAFQGNWGTGGTGSARDSLG